MDPAGGSTGNAPPPPVRAEYTAPDFATAVRYHQLLENIQRESDTGIRQDAVG